MSIRYWNIVVTTSGQLHITIVYMLHSVCIKGAEWMLRKRKRRINYFLLQRSLFNAFGSLATYISMYLGRLQRSRHDDLNVHWEKEQRDHIWNVKRMFIGRALGFLQYLGGISLQSWGRHCMKDEALSSEYVLSFPTYIDKSERKRI